MRDTKCLCRWHISFKKQKQMKLAFVLEYRHFKSDVAYVGHSRLGRTETGRHLVVRDVRYAHIDKERALVFFNQSHVI